MESCPKFPKSTVALSFDNSTWKLYLFEIRMVLEHNKPDKSRKLHAIVRFSTCKTDRVLVDSLLLTEPQFSTVCLV